MIASDNIVAQWRRGYIAPPVTALAGFPRNHRGQAPRQATSLFSRRHCVGRVSSARVEQASSLPNPWQSGRGKCPLGIQHNNAFTLVCPVATRGFAWWSAKREGSLCLAPRPGSKHARLRPACPSGHSCGHTLRVSPRVCPALRAYLRCTSPRPPWGLSAALALQPLRVFSPRARSHPRPSAPKGLPEQCAPGGAHGNARKSLACGARPAHADSHRSPQRLGSG